MTDLGFGIEETAEGFILRHGEEEIRMSKEEFFSLRLQINLWTERAMSRFQGKTGELHPLVSHPIAEAGVWPDAIQGNVLLTLTTAGETKVTFSLPIPLASQLAEGLLRCVELIPPSPMA